MKRSVVLLCMMLVTSACETTTDTLEGIINGGGSLTPAQASGNWTLTVQRTTNFPCTGALASGQAIPVFLDVASDGTLGTTSSWQNPISGVVLPLTGSVGLSNGAIQLTFDAGGGRAMELTSGTMTGGGAVTTATITDPSAGFSQAFGTDVCQYSATGIKTS